MNTKQNKRKISLRQYVLPYRNYVTGKTGWQFGMPSSEDKMDGDLRVRVVHKNGRTWSKSSFEITRPDETGPEQTPRPDWLWVPVQFDGKNRFASVIPPREAQGSVPLSRLQKTSRDAILLQPEAEDSGRPLTAPDLPFAIPAKRPAEELRAGRLILADLKIGGGQIRRIRPLEAAYELGLWTSHLSRLAELKVAHGIEP